MSYYKDDSQMIINPSIIKWNDEYRSFMSEFYPKSSPIISTWEIYLAGRKAGEEEIDRLRALIKSMASVETLPQDKWDEVLKQVYEIVLDSEVIGE